MRRPFVLPAMGLTALFALLGPAVGGAVFIPVALTLEAPTDAAPHLGWIAGLIGHAAALIPAYVVGLLPAALTGFCYALYEAWAPAWAPRALGAALIGALLAHALYLALMQAGAALGGGIESEFGAEVADIVSDWTAGEFDDALYHALIVSGAAAGLVCAMAGQLLGLRMRSGELDRSDPRQN